MPSWASARQVRAPASLGQCMGERGRSAARSCSCRIAVYCGACAPVCTVCMHCVLCVWCVVCGCGRAATQRGAAMKLKPRYIDIDIGIKHNIKY
jgi:hypothetical protein